MLQSYAVMFCMEISNIKIFFALLSKALSSEHPNSFFFSEHLEQQLTACVEPCDTDDIHDIVYLLYRLKENVLGRRDPVDQRTRKTPETLIPFACQLLESRWDKIKDTSDDYTRCSVKANQPYITFAKQLANFCVEAQKCDARLGKLIRDYMRLFSTDGKTSTANFYALLIPTLTQYLDPISRDPLINFDLHNFVLSQDERSLFSLNNSQKSFDNGDGFFNVDVVPRRLFTPLEKKRIQQKSWNLRPLAIAHTDFSDYVVTKKYPGPPLKVNTKNTIMSMIARAEAIQFDPNLCLETFQKKYNINKEPFTAQDLEWLWELHAARAEYADDASIKPLEASFKSELNKRDQILSDNDLNFLVKRTRQAKIAGITAELLVYCDVLKQENSNEYRRLMNQVLCDEKSPPKTLDYLLRYVPHEISCSEVTLLSDVSKLFKSIEKNNINTIQSEHLTKSVVAPVSSSTGGLSFLSFLYSSSDDPRSVADKMAYSPP